MSIKINNAEYTTFNDYIREEDKAGAYSAAKMLNVIVQDIRENYPVGCRVELLRMDDEQAPPVGTKGTVRGVDDAGSIMVSWDNGSSLSVVFGSDSCRRCDIAELTTKQDEMNDSFDCAVCDFLKLLFLQSDFDEGKNDDWWEMEYIGEVADAVENVLVQKGIHLCRPFLEGDTANCRDLFDPNTGTYPCGMKTCLCNND